MLNHHLGSTWCCSYPLHMALTTTRQAFYAIEISVTCIIMKEQMNGLKKRMYHCTHYTNNIHMPLLYQRYDMNLVQPLSSKNEGGDPPPSLLWHSHSKWPSLHVNLSCTSNAKINSLLLHSKETKSGVS